MLKQQIAPSMMCADYRGFTELLDTFKATGIEYLHIDVMDGVFVKNYTLGTDFCERLRAMTDIPLDIHLMITEPEWKIDWFKPRAGEYVSVHAEATNHLQRALAAIKSTMQNRWRHSIRQPLCPSSTTFLTTLTQYF